MEWALLLAWATGIASRQFYMIAGQIIYVSLALNAFAFWPGVRVCAALGNKDSGHASLFTFGLRCQDEVVSEGQLIQWNKTGYRWVRLWTYWNWSDYWLNVIYWYVSFYKEKPQIDGAAEKGTSSCLPHLCTLTVELCTATETNM